MMEDKSGMLPQDSKFLTPMNEQLFLTEHLYKVFPLFILDREELEISPSELIKLNTGQRYRYMLNFVQVFKNIETVDVL